MRNKVLAVILCLTLIVPVFWISSPFGSVEASADIYKGGYSVTASKSDDSGIALDSVFYLTSQTPVTLDYLKENLSIRGQPAPEISRLPDGRFMIKPAEKLEKNTLYVIDIKAADGSTVSFAFQTPREFAVIGNLPQDMSTNVPVDTGIELYFTYQDVTDIEKYFEISPKVEGRFEAHGYARSFIPKKLEPGTIYTVTVKKGLKAANGSQTLGEDYTFSFETAYDSKVTADPNPGSLEVSDIWYDFSTGESPVIPFYLYLPGNRDQKKITVEASVYRFSDESALIRAIRERERVPSWAYYSYSKVRTDTSSLEKAMAFSQSFDLDSRGSKYIMLPESLPHGFYIIELSCEDLSAQAFIQSSDTAAYFLEDKSKGLFWVNNLADGRPASSALVEDLSTGQKARTDKLGLAWLEGTSAGKDPAKMDFYKITTNDGKVSLLNAGYPDMPSDDSDTESLNWHYLQTDRTLYQPDDLVQFWGFVKSRLDGASPDRVTIELSEGRYFYSAYDSFVRAFLPFVLGKPLETFTLDVKDGFFEGDLQLPLLAPGSYNLTVKSEGKVLASTYIRVENYVKPQYRLTITSDKKAVFAGEPIHFTIRASFFDGTPVSNVPIRYSIDGYMNTRSGEGVTDQDGILTVAYTPQYTQGMQGGDYFGISVSTTFPEIGEIYQYKSFQVFANDTELVADGEIKHGTGTVSITAHRVELDTLNDDDPSNDEHLGQVLPGQKAEVQVYRITWDKIEVGEDYDYVNKVVRKRYEYRERKTPVTSKAVTTGANGQASFEFQADKNPEGYYTAEITSRDRKGRELKYQINLYDRSGRYPPSIDDSYPYLKSDRESYRSGEPVNLQFYKGEEPVTGCRTLFVEARNGILGAQVNDQPIYRKNFDAALSPNYYVAGVMFTGTGYLRSNCQVAYNYEEKKLMLDVKTDRESYKPGETCTVTITATDSGGKPVAAKVNVSLIDEALLQLSDQDIDPLGQLYSMMGSGIIRYTDSRMNSPIYSVRVSYGLAMNASKENLLVMDEKAQAAAPAASSAPEADGSGSISEGVDVRSDFRDTACFETIQLDENGKGTITFTLPDSITSFRLAAAAISADLHAGSEIAQTTVSMPFFINDAMSLTYLSGDKPYIGVTAYGSKLEEGEVVDFEIRCRELNNYAATASAKAFERANIPLPRLPEGTYTLEIYARSKSGLADGIKRTIQVYDSYRTMETASYKNLVPGVKIDAGESGLTSIIIADQGRGRLIRELNALAWNYGHRLDQKLTVYQAQRLLKELVNSQAFPYDPVDPDAASYRNEDGGFGILPYFSSDIRMSALLAPWLSEVTDAAPLKMYFYNALLTDETINAPALYGLAALGEPVLSELEMARNTENLSLTDYMFVGMAYQLLGETDTAREIYATRILPHIESMDPYIRVRVENGDTDASLEQTALLAAFTAGLGMEESDRMYDYVSSRYSGNVYTGAEQLIYLTERLKTVGGDTVECDYTYDGKSYQVKLENGQTEFIRIPSVKARDFQVTRVSGKASILSIYEAPLKQNAKNDSNVILTRKYFNALTGEETTTFRPNDIVKVQIDYTIKDAAMDNTYEITDYAPSGLKPLSNSSSYGIVRDDGWYYRNIDGQKVTFVVGKRDESTDYKPLTYYARVAGPGEFTAEGTVAQGSMVKSSLTVNSNTTIRILP